MEYPQYLALLLANHASASGLDELRAALLALRGELPVHGQFSVQVEKRVVDQVIGNLRSSGSASARVRADRDTLHIHWEGEVLRRAMRHSCADDAAVDEAVLAASPLEVMRSLDFAPALLSTLDEASLGSEQVSSWNGRIARTLELELPILMQEPPRTRESEAYHRLMVWIDRDGVPLAASETAKRSFVTETLMFSVHEEKTECVFGVIANRLLALTRDEYKRTAHGNSRRGFDEQTHQSFTFTPEQQLGG